jgi:hypothetical protein
LVGPTDPLPNLSFTAESLAANESFGSGSAFSGSLHCGRQPAEC